MLVCCNCWLAGIFHRLLFAFIQLKFFLIFLQTWNVNIVGQIWTAFLYTLCAVHNYALSYSFFNHFKNLNDKKQTLRIISSVAFLEHVRVGTDTQESYIGRLDCVKNGNLI